ncbi:MAG: type II toxin-antitoxin system HicB family antitoxin [Planctomycetia bacterium]|nr:type II toxin-antitoxin system HicB family antitoxin [Planctomycetia bacterium]
MKPIVSDRCEYLAGPYKGYTGRAEYDHETGLFHGEVDGTRDVITFQGKTVDQLRAAFVDSVDDYLEFCKKRGEAPEKPYSGRFLARISPQLHQQLSELAKDSGTSLNALVEHGLTAMVENEITRGPKVSANKQRKPKRRASG